MALNKLTKSALEALGEVCNEIVMADEVNRKQVKDFLECISHIIRDREVLRTAGTETATGLGIAGWYIDRWLDKWDKGKGE